jgi:glucose-1-phosphate thymidylyltransferase
LAPLTRIRHHGVSTDHFFEVTVVQAVILAAGRGSRLEPVTHYVPKPLIPFWGRPFISYLLERLNGYVDEAVIVDGPAGEIAAILGERHRDLPLRYVIQPDPVGTGDALLQACDCLRSPFLIMLADTCPPQETIRELTEAPGDAVLATIRVDDRENHGGVDIAPGGRVTGLWTDADTVDAGIIRTTSRICELLTTMEPLRGELRILQGVDAMIREVDDVRGIVMPGPWLQFGDHEGLAGVLRVMRQIHDDADSLPEGASSVDVASATDCTIANSLVFGPGELVNCTITDSMVYCGTRLEGVQITGEMAAYA